jgi:hypothetical protein
MRNNAWVALAIALGVLALSVMLHVIFITIATPDGEVIEGNLFRLEEGTNITITGSDATNTITISATGSGAAGIDVELNGTVEVTGTQVLDFLDPFNVADDGGDAQVSLPLTDDSVFVGDASSVPVATAWPDCDLKPQATIYSTGSNAIGCQFIPTSKMVDNVGSVPWTIPGWSCITISTSISAFQNDILYGLIVPPETISYTAVGMNVSLAGNAGSIARLGIYEADETASGYTPGALIVDAGTVAIDSTGVKTIAISEALERGRPYFTAFVHNATSGPSVLRCDGVETFLSPTTGRAAAAAGILFNGTLEALNIGTGVLSDPAATPDAITGVFSGTIISLSE